MKLYYRGFILVFFIGFIIFNIKNGRIFSNNSNHNKYCIEYLESEKWSGIVFGKYIDTENHNAKVIEIKRSNEKAIRIFTLSCYDQSFFDQIKIGDSIYREKGEVNCNIISKEGAKLFKPNYPNK